MQKKVAIAAGLALVAVLSLWLWSRTVVEKAQGGQKIRVPVAAEDIAPGSRINRASIAYREFPESI